MAQPCVIGVWNSGSTTRMVPVPNGAGCRKLSGDAAGWRLGSPWRSRPPAWPKAVLDTVVVIPGMLWKIADERRNVLIRSNAIR